MGNFLHIIDKVYVEVNTGSMDSANYLKNNIGRFLEAEIFPKIEQMLDVVNQTGRVVRIDSLNLDVATPRNDYLKSLKSRIPEEFMQKLQLEMKIAGKSESDGFISENSELLTTEKNRENIFLYFLKNGFLPWFGKKTDINDFLLTSEWIKALENSLFVSNLIEILDSDDLIFKRFVYQLSEDALLSFYLKVNPELKTTENVFSELLKLMDYELRHIFLKTVFYSSVDIDFQKFSNALIGLNKLIEIRFDSETGRPAEFKKIETHDVPVKPAPESLEVSEENEKFGVSEKSENSIESEKSEIKISNIRNEKILSGVNQFFESLKRKHENESDKYADIVKNVSESIKAGTPVNVIQAEEIEVYDGVIEKEFTAAVSKTEDDYKPERFSESDEIFLQNAGFILIHPFLKLFFQNNGFLNEKGRIKRNLLTKAVQTLHFIATGDEDFFEGNLVFEKFLCGMPLKMPLERESLLSEEIKAESNVLLEEIIRQWPALKNSSPDGLRQIFFNRNGKLILKDKNIRLIVERKAQDVLLDKLSWGISLVKIPWIDILIYVEW